MHRLRYLIGLCVLAGAVLGALWIVRLLRTDDDRPGLALKIEFRNAQGLRAGTDVRYRGVQVGTVRSVAISDDGGRSLPAIRLPDASSEPRAGGVEKAT